MALCPVVLDLVEGNALSPDSKGRSAGRGDGCRTLVSSSLICSETAVKCVVMKPAWLQRRDMQTLLQRRGCRSPTPALAAHAVLGAPHPASWAHCPPHRCMHVTQTNLDFFSWFCFFDEKRASSNENDFSKLSPNQGRKLEINFPRFFYVLSFDTQTNGICSDAVRTLFCATGREGAGPSRAAEGRLATPKSQFS